MSCIVVKPGLQTTIQAAPRTGLRHFGVPASGPADPLSMALANRLVGNSSMTPALEITLAGPVLGFEETATLSVAGGEAGVTLNGQALANHVAFPVRAGDELVVGALSSGARAYIGIAGGFEVPRVLGSESTYLPAVLGGIDGRIIKTGDELRVRHVRVENSEGSTPSAYRPQFSRRVALRVCTGGEAGLLDDEGLALLLDSNWRVSARADRMGMALEGPSLSINSDGRMPSRPVFPGSVQCPENGMPFLLSVDAQTTGGYPRVLQVTRADRHLLGQLRPGDHVRFLLRNASQAAEDLALKHDYWRQWLPDIASII